MLGIDTNVLVRFLVRDDVAQFEKARRLIKREVDATEVQFEDEPAIEGTLFIWKDSAADFADCLIGVHNQRLGCRATATFDAKAVKLSAFVAL